MILLTHGLVVAYKYMRVKNLKVMDATALSLCMDNKMPILVFNMHERGNVLRAVKGDKVGTVVDG